MTHARPLPVRRPARALLLASASLLAAGAAQAQTTAIEAAAPVQLAASAVDEVIIVGSRRPEQKALDRPAPVDVIDGQKLQETGYTELNQVLQTLAPSFNFSRVSGSDASSAYRPATLRGLAPDQTLVLINGKRMHRTAQVNIKGTIGRGSNPVDLNSIPLGAVKRIEVLRDGASAQYGSDAIAGVINVVLNDDPTGADLSLQTGKRTEGDGSTTDISASAGAALPNDRGFVRFSAQNLLRNRMNRVGPDIRDQYFPGDPRESSVNRFNGRLGDPKLNAFNLFGNGEFKLADTLTAYAFGSYGDQTVGSQGIFRRPNDNNTVRAIFPDGYLPGFDVGGKDYSIQGGLRYDAGGLGKFDLSAGHARNKIDFNLHNTINASLGVYPKRDFYAGGLTNEETFVNLDAVRTVPVGFFSSPLTVAAGLGYRDETYTVRAGEPDSYRNGGVPVLDGPNRGQAATPGSQGFPGFQPSDAGGLSRHSWSGYVDLETDVTPWLLAGLAARYEDYSDFGDKLTGKASARVKLSEALAIRGALSTGFRAPSLGQQRFATTETTFVTAGSPPIRSAADIKQLPVNAPAALALGASPLKPETSTNISGGVVIQPGGGFDLSIDYYRINIDDRIVLSENLLGTAVVRVLSANGVPSAAGARYFTNGVDTHTEGLDVVGNWRRDFGAYGQSSFQVGFNWGKTEVTRVVDTPAVLQAAGVRLIGRQAVGLIEKANPKTKLNFSANHRWKAFDLTARATRYGKFTSIDNATAANDQTFGAQWVADLEVGYQVQRNIKISIGADNLFDSYPDKVSNPANSTNGQYPYSSLSPNGYGGTFYYVRSRLTL